MPDPDPSRPAAPAPSEVFSSAPGITFYLDFRGIVRTTLRGRIEVNQLIEHTLSRAAAGLSGAPQVLDARAAELAISAEDVRRIALLGEELRRRGRVRPTAMVTDDDLAYGMARMFAAYDADGAGFAVFRTMAEAEAWLAG